MGINNPGWPGAVPPVGGGVFWPPHGGPYVSPPQPAHRPVPFPMRPMQYDIPSSGYNGALIITVLDESSSMLHAQRATISSFNEFLQSQKQLRSKLEGHEARATLLKFSAGRVNEVYGNQRLDLVPPLNEETYRPYGGTNLFDAIGEAMLKARAVLQEMPQSQRPAVIILIMTDGEENQSTRFNREDIKTLVAEAEKADWTFMFLGANIDAFAVGSSFGMNHNNTLQYNTTNMAGTFGTVSTAVGAVREAKSRGIETSILYASDLYQDRDKAL